jgi:hypothetical protein
MWIVVCGIDKKISGALQQPAATTMMDDDDDGRRRWWQRPAAMTMMDDNGAITSACGFNSATMVYSPRLSNTHHIHSRHMIEFCDHCLRRVGGLLTRPQPPISISQPPLSNHAIAMGQCIGFKVRGNPLQNFISTFYALNWEIFRIIVCSQHYPPLSMSPCRQVLCDVRPPDPTIYTTIRDYGGRLRGLQTIERNHDAMAEVPRSAVVEAISYLVSCHYYCVFMITI